MSAFRLPHELPKYQYQSLKRDEIRLLILQPGSPKDDFCFSLIHEHLAQPSHNRPKKRLSIQELRRSLKGNWDVFETVEGQYFFHQGNRWVSTPRHPDRRVDPDVYSPSSGDQDPNFKPSYEALSYVWGTLKTVVTVYIVNEDKSTATIQIGQNLAVALKHLRYRDRPRVLWIDAICINQKDYSERSEQVMRMGLIYGLASRVIVWLGEDRNNSRHAISMLQYIGEQVDQTKDHWVLPSEKAVEPNWYLPEVTIPFNKKTWRAIAAIYRNPWWSRIWTLQEIRLANSNAILQCGHHHMLFSVLRKATDCLRDKDGIPWEVRSAIFNTTGSEQSGRGISLTKLLYICTARHCTDPRDKIYGLLSVCPYQFANKIRPQYSLPIFEVYKDAFLAQVESSNRLDVLSYLGEAMVEFDLPTWVPNWAATEKATVTIDRKKSASGLSKAHYKFIEPRGLEVVGVRCGIVYDHTGSLPFDKSDMIDVLLKWRPKTMRGNGVLADFDFWPALRMDYFKDNYPESQSHPTAYDWNISCIGDLRRSLQTLPDVHLAALQGSSGFSTEEAFMGFGPGLLQRGDLVYVVLGCCAPLILREGASGTFSVIGACYAQGFMNAEALLGRLPRTWTVQYIRNTTDENLNLVYFNKTTMTTAEDPRLGPLPKDWKKVEKERNLCDPEVLGWFENKATGELVNYDPRLTPELLKERGVKLQTVRLF